MEHLLYNRPHHDSLIKLYIISLFPRFFANFLKKKIFNIHKHLIGYWFEMIVYHAKARILYFFF